MDLIEPLPEARSPIVATEPTGSPGLFNPWLPGLILTLAGIGGAVFMRARRANGIRLRGPRYGGRHQSGRRI
ncbi:MAG: hypothetical protein ACRDYX_03425 [Egibacteraceae bacterium]